MISYGIKKENIISFPKDLAVSNPIKDIQEYVDQVKNSNKSKIKKP